MIFFNNNLAMGEPIILESLPNTRPTPTTKFIVPEHIVGTANLFIYIDGKLQRNNYADSSWNHITFNEPIAANQLFTAILFTDTGEGSGVDPLYHMFLNARDGEIIYRNSSKEHGVETDYSLIVGNFIDDPNSFDWDGVADGDFQIIFNTWQKFSHGQNGLFPSMPSELNGWSFLNGRIICSTNSTSYIGWVTPQAEQSYKLQATFKSNDSDDDTISLVLAFVEESGKEYTISAVRSNDGLVYRWALVYNFMQPDEWVIDDGTTLVQPGLGNWANTTNGVFVQGEKTGARIIAKTSQMNELPLVEASQLEVDLSSDLRLLKFLGPTQYGYGAFSQRNATFENINLVETDVYDMNTHTHYKYSPAEGWTNTSYTDIGELLGYGKFCWNETQKKLFYTGQGRIDIGLHWKEF